MDLLSATLTLILIMDPLGNIPMFLSILNKIPDENRRRKISDSRIIVGIVGLIGISLFGTSSASMAQSPTSIVENRGRDCPFSDRN